MHAAITNGPYLQSATNGSDPEKSVNINGPYPYALLLIAAEVVTPPVLIAAEEVTPPVLIAAEEVTPPVGL